MAFSPEEVKAEIDRQAPEFGVNPDHAYLLATAENSKDGSNPTFLGDAVSPKGAQNLFQVMPSTAIGLQKAGLIPVGFKTDSKDLSSQVTVGLAAIKDMTSRMKDPNNIYELGAYYNGGNAGHANYLAGRPLVGETSGYLNKLKIAGTKIGMKMPDLTPDASTPTGGSAPTFTPLSMNTVPGDTTRGTSTQSTTVRKNVNNPSDMANFTNEVTGAIGPGGAFQTATDQIIAGGKTRAALMDVLTGAIRDKAAAAGEEAAAQTAYDAGQAANRSFVLDSLNLNPQNTQNARIATARVINDQDAAMQAIKPEIDQRMAVGMFDNPFQWLVNQTILPGLVAQYNGHVSTQNAAIDSYKQMSTMVDDAERQSAATDADNILRKGVATKAKIAAQATEDLSTAQLNANRATIADALSLANVASEGVNVAGKQVALTREQQVTRDQNSTKEELQAAEKKRTDDFNKVVVAAGGTPVATLKGIPAKDLELATEATSSGKYGKTFGSAFNFVQKFGDPAVMQREGLAGTVEWHKGTLAQAGKAVDDFIKDPVNKGHKVDPEELTNNELNRIQRVYQSEAETNMTGANKYNPYKIDYTSIAKDPKLAGNPVAIFLKQYGPGGTDPRFAKVDEQFLLDRFTSSVIEGKMSLPVATSAITDFYKVATQQQALNTHMTLYGMNMPTKTYPVTLSTHTGFWGGSSGAVVDLGNQSAVENYLTKNVASRAMTDPATAKRIIQNAAIVNP